MTDSLRQQREFLLASLRDLEREHEAGDIDEPDYLRLRDDYTARAAAVLGDIEGEDASGRESGQEPGVVSRVRRGGRQRGRRAGRPRGRRPKEAEGSRRPGPHTYVAAILVTVLVGLAIGVLAFSTDRPAGQPPRSPAAATLARAHQLEGEGKAADALEVYDDLLKSEPDNAEALTYRGWLLARAGLVDQAMQSLDRAVALNPGYPDAHFFRGMLLFRERKDPAAAIPEFEAFLANNPPAGSVPSVQNVLDQARQAAAGATPAPAPVPGG